MQHIRRLFLLCVSLLTIGLAVAKKVALTASNIESMPPGQYFVIDDDIDITGMNITFRAGTIVEFDHGRLTGSGSVTFDGATVVAAAYTIFDGVTVAGVFGNDEVEAAWFGRFEADSLSATVNRALASAPRNTVQIGGGDYKFGKTIKITTDGQRLACAGKLEYNNAHGDLAIDIAASYVKIDIRQLDSDEWQDKEEYKATAIALNGSVAHGRFNINQVNYFDRLFTVQSAVATDNVVEFQYWKATTPIYVNLSDGAQFRRNTFYGARLIGDYGICYEKESAKAASHNVYDCLGFENIAKCCIALHGSSFDRIVDARMNESFPDKNSTRNAIELANTDHAYIMTKGYFISDYLSVCEGCSGNILDIAMSSDYLTYMAPTRVLADAVTPFPVPVTDSLIKKYQPLTTFDLGAYNMVKQIEYPTSAAAKTDVVNLKDLMPETHRYDGQNQTVLGNLCKIKIGRNRRIVLKEPNYVGSYLMPRADFDLVLDIEQGGAFTVDNRTMYTADEDFNVTQSGTYRLSLTLKDGKYKDNGVLKDQQQWTTTLTKIL